MATLQELKKRNVELRFQLAEKQKLIDAKKELLEIGKKRNALIKENAKLMREAKFGSQLRFARGVGKGLGKASVKAGKIGLIAGKALIKHAKKIAEADEREKRLASKIKKRSQKKKTSRRKTKKRR